MKEGPSWARQGGPGGHLGTVGHCDLISDGLRRFFPLLALLQSQLLLQVHSSTMSVEQLKSTHPHVPWGDRLALVNIPIFLFRGWPIGILLLFSSVRRTMVPSFLGTLLEVYSLVLIKDSSSECGGEAQAVISLTSLVTFVSDKRTPNLSALPLLWWVWCEFGTMVLRLDS